MDVNLSDFGYTMLGRRCHLVVIDECVTIYDKDQTKETANKADPQ